MKEYNISIFLALKLINTKKDFILFNVDNNNKIKEYVLTNDYARFKNRYSNFKVISCISNQLTNLKIY